VSTAPRPRGERRRDTEHRLAHDVDVWVATAAAGGDPLPGAAGFPVQRCTLRWRASTEACQSFVSGSEEEELEAEVPATAKRSQSGRLGVTIWALESNWTPKGRTVAPLR
jgi:hypothetical protein